MRLQNQYKQMSTIQHYWSCCKRGVSGNGVDASVLEAEMQKLAYNFALQMTDILEKNLPVILESLAQIENERR